MFAVFLFSPQSSTDRGSSDTHRQTRQRRELLFKKVLLLLQKKNLCNKSQAGRKESCSGNVCLQTFVPVLLTGGTCPKTKKILGKIRRSKQVLLPFRWDEDRFRRIAAAAGPRETQLTINM